MAARRGRTGYPVPHKRGPVPAAAGAGRGAQVRDHLPSGEEVKGADDQRTGRRARPWPGPAVHAAAPLRLRAQAGGGQRRRDRRVAGNRAQRGRGGRYRLASAVCGGWRTGRGGRGRTVRNDQGDAYREADAPHIVIVTGMSGAGRSTAAKALEDMGWFVVDNLPPALLPTMVDLAARSAGGVPRVAAVVDVRSRAFTTDLNAATGELAIRGAAPRVVFLEAADDTLVRRF